MENNNLATEILGELKTTNKRMFIALCISFAINIAVVGGFLWYISLPTEMENVTVESTSTGHANYVGGEMSGEIINGESDSKADSQSNTKQKVVK